MGTLLPCFVYCFRLISWTVKHRKLLRHRNCYEIIWHRIPASSANDARYLGTWLDRHPSKSNSCPECTRGLSSPQPLAFMSRCPGSPTQVFTYPDTGGPPSHLQPLSPRTPLGRTCHFNPGINTSVRRLGSSKKTMFWLGLWHLLGTVPWESMRNPLEFKTPKWHPW